MCKWTAQRNRCWARESSSRTLKSEHKSRVLHIAGPRQSPCTFNSVAPIAADCHSVYCYLKTTFFSSHQRLSDPTPLRVLFVTKSSGNHPFGHSSHPPQLYSVLDFSLSLSLSKKQVLCPIHSPFAQKIASNWVVASSLGTLFSWK